MTEAECTCGSGAHPRPCEEHPDAYAAHVKELNSENDMSLLEERVVNLENTVKVLAAELAQLRDAMSPDDGLTEGERTFHERRSAWLEKSRANDATRRPGSGDA